MSRVVSILRVQRHYFASASGARASVRHFAGYTQYRDQHPDSELARDVDGLVGYMRFRDVTSRSGRMFDAAGPAGSAERDGLVSHVDQSFEAIHAEGKRSSTNNLAYYDLIISPEDARGLDLQAVTRTTMEQAARDAGSGGLAPWIAAEHRNTRHPHVHVVVAGIRRTPSGAHRTFQLTPSRLENMKAAMNGEIARQRGEREQDRSRVVRRLDSPVRETGVVRHGGRDVLWRSVVDLARGSRLSMPRRSAARNRGSRQLATALGRSVRLSARIRSHYRREVERALRERKWSSDRGRDDLERAA